MATRGMTKSQYLRDRVFLNMAANRRFYARASIDNLTRISTTADRLLDDRARYVYDARALIFISNEI